MARLGTLRGEYVGETLTGSELRGCVVSGGTLIDCDLRAADLRGATLSRVDIRRSDLRGALLEDATLEYVNASGARLADVHGRGLRIEHSKLACADLSAADLRGTALHSVDLDGALLHGANLARASITYSNCTATAFDDAMLERLNTVGSSFRDASFDSARNFFRSHEVVAEILRRHASNDPEKLRWIGAISLDRSRCYAQWRADLENRPEYMRFALEVLASYPRSGCAEALSGDSALSTPASSLATGITVG